MSRILQATLSDVYIDDICFGPTKTLEERFSSCATFSARPKSLLVMLSMKGTEDNLDVVFLSNGWANMLLSRFVKMAFSDCDVSVWMMVLMRKFFMLLQLSRYECRPDLKLTDRHAKLHSKQKVKREFERGIVHSERSVLILIFKSPSNSDVKRAATFYAFVLTQKDVL